LEWVIDNSVALAWVLNDEQSATANRFLTEIAREDQLWIPPLWWYEVSNALAICRRRGRVSEPEAHAAFSRLDGLMLMTDTLLGREGMARFYSLASANRLTAYDASYLELAQRKGIGLATLDERLAAAAMASGVEVFA
jgi:predicted nucleic acid-binding protein